MGRLRRSRLYVLWIRDGDIKGPGVWNVLVSVVILEHLMFIYLFGNNGAIDERLYVRRLL